jgi:phospho-2-dehydro-3-deoxyheptonate aldolase
MFSQPDPEKSEDILKGILTIRDLNIKAIEVSGLTAADEMLYPANIHYVDDLLSYIAVGARSCENQLHRLVASGIDACTFKFYICRTERTGIQAERLAGQDEWQPLGTRNFEGCGG